MEFKYILFLKVPFCRFMHSLFKLMKTFLFEESVLRYKERNCFLSYPDHYLIIPLLNFVNVQRKPTVLCACGPTLWNMCLMYVTCVNAWGCAIYVTHSLCYRVIRHSKDLITYNHWDSNAIFIFCCHSGFPHKTVYSFRNFLAVLPPPTLYKVETRKKILDTCVQHCLWGEGKGWACVNNLVPWILSYASLRSEEEREPGNGVAVWIGKRPEMQKCPKTFVHDCSS